MTEISERHSQMPQASNGKHARGWQGIREEKGKRNSEMELETFKDLKTLCKNAVIIYGEKKK